MAISMGAALLGSALIGGATSILGSSSQSHAANQAAQAQNQAAQLQYQLGQQSLQQNRDIYNNNVGFLSPFVSRGNVAGDSINALLGLPSAPAMQSPLGGTALASGTVPAPGSQSGVPQVNPGLRTGAVPTNANSLNPGIPAPAPAGHGGGLAALRTGDLGLPTIGPRALGANDSAGMHGGSPGNPSTPAVAGTGGGGGSPPSAGGTPATTPGVTPISATDALNNFANSAGMQFQLKQGADALNNLYAGAGQLQSGAAMKAMQGYGQQTALNNYFMPYMGLLGGQQAVGAGAASSIAGVGSSFGNTAAAINAGMGANIQNGANSASNAALARGAANANMWAGIGSGIGGLASSFVPMGGGGGGIVSNYHYAGPWG
jgi:hypothetical protein